MHEFYNLNLKAYLRFITSQNPSFAFICGYFFFEYFRPQSIYPAIDILPWPQLFLILAGVAWLLDPARKFFFNTPLVLFGVYNLMIFTSVIWAVFPEWTTASYLNCYSWALIFFITVNIVNSRKRLFIVMGIIFLASYKMSLHGTKIWAERGFSFASWGIAGPKGYFQNSGELSIQLLIFGAWSYWVVLAMRPHIPKWKFWFMMSMPITSIISIIGANSRGAQLSMVILVTYVFLRDKISFGRIAILVAVCGFAYAITPQQQLDRFYTVGEDGTSKQRILYWERGFEIIQDRPFTGIGYANFRPYFSLYYPEDVIGLRAEEPHNIFIQAGTDLGYPGIIMLLIIVFSVYRISRWIRAQSPPDKLCYDEHSIRGLWTGVIAWLMAGQFVSVLYYPFFWIQAALICCMYNIIRAEQKKPLTLRGAAGAAAPIRRTALARSAASSS